MIAWLKKRPVEEHGQAGEHMQHVIPSRNHPVTVQCTLRSSAVSEEQSANLREVDCAGSSAPVDIFDEGCGHLPADGRLCLLSGTPNMGREDHIGKALQLCTTPWTAQCSGIPVSEATGHEQALDMGCGTYQAALASLEGGHTTAVPK